MYTKRKKKKPTLHTTTKFSFTDRLKKDKGMYCHWTRSSRNAKESPLSLNKRALTSNTKAYENTNFTGENVLHSQNQIKNAIILQ